MLLQPSLHLIVLHREDSYCFSVFSGLLRSFQESGDLGVFLGFLSGHDQSAIFTFIHDADPNELFTSPLLFIPVFASTIYAVFMFI